MSMHVEWLSAKESSVTFLLPGQEAIEDDEDTRIEERDGIGIQISGDDAVVILGEPGAIRSLAMKIIRQTVLAELGLDRLRAKQAKELKKKVEAAL